MRRLIHAAVGATWLFVAASAAAEEPQHDPVSDVVIVDGHQGSTGAVKVNAAAGTNNQQANVGVIASGETANASAIVVQSMANPPTASKRSASAEIQQNAFAGSSGWIAANLASGSDNQQANIAVIAFGIEGQVATDAILSQTRASNEPIGEVADSAVPQRAVAIGEGAFENASGLVQLSLVGGERNSSANVFALTVSAGANQ